METWCVGSESLCEGFRNPRAFLTLLQKWWAEIMSFGSATVGWRNGWKWKMQHASYFWNHSLRSECGKGSNRWVSVVNIDYCPPKKVTLKQKLPQQNRRESRNCRPCAPDLQVRGSHPHKHGTLDWTHENRCFGEKTVRTRSGRIRSRDGGRDAKRVQPVLEGVGESSVQGEEGSVLCSEPGTMREHEPKGKKEKMKMIDFQIISIRNKFVINSW